MELEKGCPCCQFYKDDVEFKKVIELERAGLVIYRHITPMNYVASVSQSEKAFNIHDNVFIIHNTKNKNVLTSIYMSEFEHAIHCPRCRYIVKHTKALLQNLPFIRKKDVIGICDHCRFKKRLNDRCHKCQIAVEEFLKKQEQKQTEIRDSDKQGNGLSSTEFDEYLKKERLRQKQAPEIELDLEQLHLTELEEYLKRERIMQTQKPKIELDLERLRSTELEEYFKKENDLFSPITDGPQISPLEKTDTHEKENIKNRKKDQHSYYDIHYAKYDQEVSKSSQKDEDIFLRGIQKQRRSVYNIRRYSSEETLVKPVSATTESKLYKDFSYRFIKKTDVKTPPPTLISSSELIKDTQDMYRARAEEERIKKEKELKEKLEAADKKRLAKIERKRYLEEERRLEELKKKKAEEERLLEELKKKKAEEVRSIEELKKKKFEQEGPLKELKEKKPEEERSLEELGKIEAEEVRSIEELKKKKSEQEGPLKELKKKKPEEERPLEELEKKKAEEVRSIEELKKKKSEQEGPLKELKKKKPEEERPLEELDKKKAEEVRSIEELKKKKSEQEGSLKELKKKKPEEERPLEELEKKKAEEVRSIEELKKKKSEQEGPLKELKKKKPEEERPLEELDKKKDEEVRSIEELKKKKSEQEGSLKELKKKKQKANNEEQMRLAKEEKQRQKEEKDKDKANRDEQMRKGKEEKKEKKEQEAQSRIDKGKKQREKEERLRAKEDRHKEKEQIRRQTEKNENGTQENEEFLNKKELENQLVIDKQKEKESKLKIKREEEVKKKDPKLKLKSLGESTAVKQAEKPQDKNKPEELKIKDLKQSQVKIKNNSQDNLILKLVKLKHTGGVRRERPTRLSHFNISNNTLIVHMTHQNTQVDNCLICLDSDLELDIEKFRMNETQLEEIKEIIMGQKIFKYKHLLLPKKEDKEIKPLFFKSIHAEGEDNIVTTQTVKENIAQEKEKKPPILSAKYVEHEVPKGIMRYALSDRTFIEKGWTMLPTEKVVRKMNVYRMRPAHPEFDWFEHNKSRKLIYYDTGEKLAEFEDNGKSRWFYRNGKVALDYYDAKEINAQHRIIIFSSGEPDERGCSRPFAILATFDYLGNGIVFDHSGKIRLKYNQTEGVVLDRAIGPVSHWKWHTLNDPPVLQQVMIDTQMAHKDPEILKLGGPHDKKPRPDNEEMLSIEFDNFIKEKSKKLSQKFKPFQIKMKALKINEYFSLKVLDQATVYLIYRDGSTNLKLNIGMILDHQEIVDTDTAEVGEVSNSLERFPARTDSLAALQRSVAHAQHVERARVERSQRLRPAQPCASADRLLEGLARPLRPTPPGHGSCQCRKPNAFNLYYDTRLI